MMVNIETLLNYSFFDLDRIPYAIVAVLLSVAGGLLSGAFRLPALPFLWLVFNSTLGVLGQRLDKKHRPKADLVFRGFVLLMFGIILFALLGRVLDAMSQSYGQFGVLEVVYLSLCLASGSLFVLILRVFKGLAGAKDDLSKGTNLALSKGDQYCVTREALSFVSRGFDKMCVAPVIFYLIGGLPIVCVYVCIMSTAWFFGKNGFTKGFGALALSLDFILSLIPSFIAAFFIALAAVLTPKTHPLTAFGAFLNVFRYAPYHQGAGCVSVMAHALNVQLGGAVSDIHGSAIQNEWVGPKAASAKVSKVKLQHGLYLIVVAHLLFLMVLGLAYAGLDGVLSHIPQIQAQ